jgi:hypothetical protein
MLRSLTAKQFHELVDFDQMESPELRMDLRFAILASLVAIAGHVQSVDGTAYSPAHFLQQLHNSLERHDEFVRGEREPQPVATGPDMKTMTMHLRNWFSGVNSRAREGQGKIAISNLTPGASRSWLARLRARSSA